ncbi:aldehyde dehydrogenase [Persicobacter psychrovividus]|uniref:Aldehyde dehydrogenase n=1 Tax=Persicobacter psychrovividus TaxID=387638 RepID=A0ABN6L507_9BACT|nr:aldehyde dehydrogenase [Persicobacter psychrovividus]
MSETINQTLSPDQATTLLEAQQAYFQQQHTRDLSFRKRQLQKLLQAVENFEPELTEAVQRDFRKSTFETFITEIGMLKVEIKHALKHLKKWTKPQVQGGLSLVNFPARNFLYQEPLGVSLIIAPWNYPILLALSPLIGAIAAGCCAVIKPSELTPHTSAVLKRLITSTFLPEYISLVEGGAETASELLSMPFNHIFFTGSSKVGQIVAKAAAEQMIPATLELGGKSPVIVHRDADIEVAARRVVWGKFLNAGQTCVAPDYVLVHREVHDAFVEALQVEVIKAYGDNIQQNEDYPRIISNKHYKRLEAMLQPDKVAFGGVCDELDLYISPTVMVGVAVEDAVMQEEIFGPVLPILSYDGINEIAPILNKLSHPLAFYVFSENRHFTNYFIENFPFGGGCINDVVAHLAEQQLPFGGMGKSGYGQYHGRYSVEAFSHRKGVMKKPTFLDVPFRYAPYGGKLKLMRQLFQWF